MNWKEYPIVKRYEDDTYVITKNNNPHHVPNEGQWHTLWKEVNAYALKHPDQVTDEEPMPVAQVEPEVMLERIEKAIQRRLDRFAQKRGYDSALSAVSYANSANPRFKTEGRYALEARDATWAKGVEILNAIRSKQRPMLTIKEVFSELPRLRWPSTANRA